MKTGRTLQELAIELEAAGWSILNMSPSLWRQLNTAR